MTFRMEATYGVADKDDDHPDIVKFDLEPDFVEYDGQNYTASESVLRELNAADGEFHYSDNKGALAARMEARRSPWHWYQAGLAILGYLGDGEPSVKGDAPEPGPEALEDLKIAYEPDDVDLTEDDDEPVGDVDNGESLDVPDLSGTTF